MWNSLAGSHNKDKRGWDTQKNAGRRGFGNKKEKKTKTKMREDLREKKVENWKTKRALDREG